MGPPYSHELMGSIRFSRFKSASYGSTIGGSTELVRSHFGVNHEDKGNALQDLKKARENLDFEIKQRE